MLNNFVMPNLLPAIPELVILVMACAILLIDVFLKDRDPERNVAFFLTQATLLICLLLALTATGTKTFTFSGMFVSDLLSEVLKFFTYFVVSVVLFYSRPYILDRPQMAKGEFYVLALFATLGMMVMISANHFLTVYLGIEMLSLSLYAMVAINRDSREAVEASMKYFVLGALASGLLLYGMSMIYGATGTLDIAAVAEQIGASTANHRILLLGLVFLVCGIAFKLGVVPFHMWIPDVYHGAPTAVTLFIATAPKLAGFAMVIRLLVGGLFVYATEWQLMLVILSILSMLIGNLAAIAQTNLKRMLAYSGISHMGFMLLGIVSGVSGGGFDPEQILTAYSSAMFYVISYVIMSMGTFGMILLLAREGFEADQLSDYKGLNKRNPWLAAIMMFLMFSMAGIPFFIGFFAKFSVLMAVVKAGWTWLAVLAVIFSLIGAFYYLRVVKLMYFDEPADPTPVRTTLDMRILISANGLAVVVFGLLPNTLMFLCQYALMNSLWSHG